MSVILILFLVAIVVLFILVAVNVMPQKTFNYAILILFGIYVLIDSGVFGGKLAG